MIQFWKKRKAWVLFGLFDITHLFCSSKRCFTSVGWHFAQTWYFISFMKTGQQTSNIILNMSVIEYGEEMSTGRTSVAKPISAGPVKIGNNYCFFLQKRLLFAPIYTSLYTDRASFVRLISASFIINIGRWSESFYKVFLWRNSQSIAKKTLSVIVIRVDFVIVG